MAEQQSYLYLGLAGETGPGRIVDSGLFRLADGSNEWEPIQRGLPEMPAVRALAVHPANPAILYAGTQSGLCRSADRGEHWEWRRGFGQKSRRHLGRDGCRRQFRQIHGLLCMPRRRIPAFGNAGIRGL